MRLATCLAVFGMLSVATAALAETPQSAAADAYAAVFAAKRVPAADKNSVDMVGKVLGGAGISACGVPVFTIGLLVGNQILFAQCAGASMYTTCGRFSVGQRVHLQGLLAQVPDTTTPGFDPCDPSTWQRVVPLNAFAALKSVR
jgi:hypothetical protein